MRLTVLFWNIGRNDAILDALRALVAEHEVDVLILAESERIPEGRLLLALNENENLFTIHQSECDKVRVLARFASALTRPVFESARYSIREFNLPGFMPFLMTAVHLPSKMHRSEQDQIYLATSLSSSIRKVESELGHRRTIIVGDLNMNPFETGMVAAGGLHGVSAPGIAERRERRVDGIDHPFFYNPMWSRFARPNEAPGTYYSSSGADVVYFWHLFDQVLIRPELLPCFPLNDLQIIDRFGETGLLTRAGLPDSKRFSDHLPLLFRLDLTRIGA
jgi:hypothetical protein